MQRENRFAASAYIWAAAATLLGGVPAGAAAPCAEPVSVIAPETTMNESTAPASPELHNVTVVIDHQSFVITPADAAQIGAALQGYLDAHPTSADGAALPRVAGQAWVDSRGTLRFGAWMLGARGDHLVLTLRDAPAPGTTSAYLLTGLVVRTAQGWQVPSVGLSRVQYR